MPENERTQRASADTERGKGIQKEQKEETVTGVQERIQKAKADTEGRNLEGEGERR